MGVGRTAVSHPTLEECRMQVSGCLVLLRVEIAAFHVPPLMSVASLIAFPGLLVSVALPVFDQLGCR